MPLYTTADTTADTAGSEPSGEFAELCALAQVMNDQEMPPTAAEPQAAAPSEQPVAEAETAVPGGPLNTVDKTQTIHRIRNLAAREHELRLRK